jgi:hypothetical protein
LAEAREQLQVSPHAAGSTVLLLDVAVTTAASELGLPAGVGVVRLVLRGTLTDSNEVPVPVFPLIYHDLIHGLVLASGRVLVAGNPDQVELRRVRPRKIAPSLEEALKARQLILLAEDNETNREVMQEQLSILGYTCEVAEDGVVALQMWHSGQLFHAQGLGQIVVHAALAAALGLALHGIGCNGDDGHVGAVGL